MSKPFGYSYLLDLYDCREGAADDLELNYRFLEKFVDIIGMTKQGPPHVYHGPTGKGVELYPDKAGVSAWIALIESGIQIHTIEPKRFVSIDVYTCGTLNTIEARKFAVDTYGAMDFDEAFITRGGRY